MKISALPYIPELPEEKEDLHFDLDVEIKEEETVVESPAQSALPPLYPFPTRTVILLSFRKSTIFSASRETNMPALFHEAPLICPGLISQCL